MSFPGSPASDLILYQTEAGKTRIQCRFEDESIWLTQAQIAELYQKDVKTINEHLLNIYGDKELDEDSTIQKFRIVRLDGKREVTREISHDSLQAILAVGIRRPTGEVPFSTKKRLRQEPVPGRGAKMEAANWKGSKTMKTDDLILEIQSLLVEERARVADSVLRSLNQTASEVDQKWTRLATKRLQDIQTGSVKPVAAEVVFNEIWHRFR